MRILILTQWYPPEPALLMHELAQELQTLGHHVQVLTGFPNYPSGNIYEGYRLRPWVRESLDGVEIVRTWLYPNHSQSGMKRVFNYLSFAISSSLLGVFLAKRPDVIFVYHPPLTVGIPAWLLSRMWRVPFVYQIQDMWPETLLATGMVVNSRLLHYVAQFANWIYKKAAVLLVISDGFRDNLVDKGVPEKKICVVSNWVDPTVYFPDSQDGFYACELGLQGKFTVMFAGNMGEAQALETVMQAALLLRDKPQIQFVFVGDGIALERLQALKKQEGLDNVLFLGRFRPDEMPKLYAQADVLLIHLKDDPLFRITIPHKTFAYMASGKPVLAAVAGDAGAVIEEAQAGYACPPQNATALAETVSKMAEMGIEALAAMGNNGRKQVLTKYSRAYLVRKIENVLEKAAFPITKTD